jgi:outer membrane protein insertion porin family
VTSASAQRPRSRNSLFGRLPVALRSWRALAIALAVFSIFSSFSLRLSAQEGPNTIYQIRVIGNRRIPKETILARLFTHVGDTYDPASIERDFNSLWNTGYFEDLRIEREDSEKGIILDIFVLERPTINHLPFLVLD